MNAGICCRALTAYVAGRTSTFKVFDDVTRNNFARAGLHVERVHRVTDLDVARPVETSISPRSPHVTVSPDFQGSTM